MTNFPPSRANTTLQSPAKPELSLEEVLKNFPKEPASEKNVNFKLSHRLASVKLAYSAQLKASRLPSGQTDFMFSKEGVRAFTEISYLEELSSALNRGLNVKQGADLYNDYLKNNSNSAFLRQKLSEFCQGFRPPLPNTLPRTAVPGDLYPLRQEKQIPVKVIVLEVDDGKLLLSQQKPNVETGRFKQAVEDSNKLINEVSGGRAGLSIEPPKGLKIGSWNTSYESILAHNQIRPDGKSLTIVFGPPHFFEKVHGTHYMGNGLIVSVTDPEGNIDLNQASSAIVREFLHGMISKSGSLDPKSMLVSGKHPKEVYLGLSAQEADYLQWPRKDSRKIVP